MSSRFFASYYGRFALLTIVLALLALVLFSTFLAGYYFRAFPFLLILIAGVTLVFHQIMMRYLRKNRRKFNNAFLAGTMLKLLFFLMLVILYLLLIKEKMVTFVASFFIMYILYNAFEVSEFVRINKSE